MSRLTIYEDSTPGVAVFCSEDPVAVAAELTKIGVDFARWESPVHLADDAGAEEILAAYRPYLDALMGATGAGSADVVKLTPDNPAAPALREKFLQEHTHSEDEIRFFVQGSGHFVIHENGRVYDASRAICCGCRPTRSTGSMLGKAPRSRRCGCSPIPPAGLRSLPGIIFPPASPSRNGAARRRPHGY
jgi:cupin superfamily acireductone dioxygenase involved in methionine salvage